MVSSLFSILSSRKEVSISASSAAAAGERDIVEIISQVMTPANSRVEMDCLRVQDGKLRGCIFASFPYELNPATAPPVGRLCTVTNCDTRIAS